jgi:UDP-glucose 4-epimerase
MAILLTGGLGYIGSHIAHLLGSKSVIIDNLSNSALNYKKLLPKSIVYEENLNKQNLIKIFQKHKITGVIHLAGLKAVNESIIKPLNYYQNNFTSSLELLEAMDKFNINKLIFSSSATVYGSSKVIPFKEDLPLCSINPYASTKILIEKLISDYAKSNKNFKSISLRYFNPIGADVSSGLSEQPLGNPQNIIPVLIKAIKDKKIFKVYGNDYETPDGTCIRDYIHVSDLASAHLIALKKLSKIKGCECINLGLGKGISVLEFIKIFEKVNQLSVRYGFSPRRKGDVAVSFADTQKSKKILQWKPKHSYEQMMKDSWKSFLQNSK